MDEARLSAPSAGRNREPILWAIRPYLPRTGLVLEVASGTGEHVAFFAAATPALSWQPSDPAPERRQSIDAWTDGRPNVRPAMALDAAATAWPVTRADAVLCINMVHISPWSATEGLFAGAARILAAGRMLMLYGPYRHRGVPMEPGNRAFDIDLRQRNPTWGLREVEAMAALGDEAGFAPPVIVPMPADNLMLMFQRN